MITNPQLLPKVRSDAIMNAANGQPCSLRIASFVGLSCSGPSTCVSCHLPVIGKGVSTKATDLAVAFGCHICHEIIDGRAQNLQELIIDKYPSAFANRLLNAQSSRAAQTIQKM